MCDWCLVTGSQILNVLTGGRRDQMICARAYRRGWWVARLNRKVARHCKAMHLHETRHNGKAKE